MRLKRPIFYKFQLSGYSEFHPLFSHDYESNRLKSNTKINSLRIIKYVHMSYLCIFTNGTQSIKKANSLEISIKDDDFFIAGL